MTGLAFGIGPRNCIGYKVRNGLVSKTDAGRNSAANAQLALQEAKITLVRLYQSLTFDVDMDRHGKGLKTAHHFTLQPVDGVHCRVKRRH